MSPSPDTAFVPTLKRAFGTLWRGNATWRGAFEAGCAGIVIMICMGTIKGNSSGTPYQPPATTYTAPAPPSQPIGAPRATAQQSLSLQDLNAIRKASGNDVVPLGPIAPVIVKPSITDSDYVLPEPNAGSVPRSSAACVEALGNQSHRLLKKRNRRLLMDHKRLSAVLVGLSVFHLSRLPAQTSAPAGSPIENRVNALENKVNKMDSNVSQILELLKNKPPSSTDGQSVSASTPAGSPSAAVPDKTGAAVAQIAKPDTQAQKLQPGALLDVWLLEPGNNEIPTTPSMGTLLDPKDYFSLARYLDEPTLKASQGQPLGFLWSGFLKIKEKGQHVFVVELTHGQEYSAGMHNLNWNRSDIISLTSVLQIEGNPVLIGDDSFKNDKEHGATTPFSAVVELEPGLYKFQLWVTARATENDKKTLVSLLHKNLSVAVKMRAPGSRTAVPLSSADIFHKE